MDDLRAELLEHRRNPDPHTPHQVLTRPACITDITPDEH